jgi:serine protease AprX
MVTQRRLTSVLIGRAVLVAVASAFLATPAQAQHHRARLSADLADHLTAGSSSSVEVIIDGDKATVDRLASRYNLVVKRYMRSGGVVRVNAGQLFALQQDDELEHLSGDIKYRPAAIGQIDPIDEGIGADQVWAGAGDVPRLSGKGVTVAVIDSGIDPKHNALKGRVLYTVDFTGGNGTDRFGHGTHVAAIIAGQPGLLPDTRMYRGVASGAYLVNLRVLDDNGEGTASNVIEAVDWAIDHRNEYNIRVINLSLGGPVLQPYRDDPVCEAVERALRAGILVVTAAGNYGQTSDGKTVIGGITSPGNSPYAMTVGALDTNGTADRSDDTVASFSSNGPTRFDLVIKPDIVAPGRRITSAEAAGSLLSVNFPQQHVAGSGANAYIKGSGTSMAAAFVSGAAALLIQERPSLKPLSVKAALQLSSTFIPEAGLVRGGTGSLNVLAAAEFVCDGDLGETTIAGEAIGTSSLLVMPGKTFHTLQSTTSKLRSRDFASQIGWKAHHNGRLSTGSDSVIWGNSDSVIWGNSDSVIWGNSDSVIWGNSDSVIWGNSDSVIWGNSDSVIWGNSDSVIWGNSDSVIWGNSDSVIWGNSDSVIWGNSDSVIWGNSDLTVWGA